MQYAGDPRSAAEALFRRGYDALPVLFDRLPHLPHWRDQAHVLAMLASITGLGQSRDKYRNYGPLTELIATATKNGTVKFETAETWPDLQLDVDYQRETLRSWKRHASFVQLAQPGARKRETTRR